MEKLSRSRRQVLQSSTALGTRSLSTKARMVKSLFLVVLAMLMQPLVGHAQEGVATQLPQLTRIEQDEANITLDGFIDEEVWKNLPVVDGMKVIDPDTLADPAYETHVRFFYT